MQFANAIRLHGKCVARHGDAMCVCCAGDACMHHSFRMTGAAGLRCGNRQQHQRSNTQWQHQQCQCTNTNATATMQYTIAIVIGFKWRERRTRGTAEAEKSLRSALKGVAIVSVLCGCSRDVARGRPPEEWMQLRTHSRGFDGRRCVFRENVGTAGFVFSRWFCVRVRVRRQH